MAITAGNYIIRSAIDEDIVLLTSGGSKSKGAFITAGALTEADNRCYWKAAVVSSTYNSFYNLKSGIKAGYIMAKTVSDGKAITQGAYKVGTGAWTATLSGNTMTVRGQSVNTYFLTAKADSTLYLTVPDNGGDLYLTTVLDDTTPQEFYLEASTYVNTKLATPTNLTLNDGLTYKITSSGAATSLYPQWNSSSTNTIYELRSRTRMYDTYGDAADWGDWTDWSMVQAAKNGSGIMKSTTSVSGPAVDNSTYSQADIQIEARLTSAKTSGAYNKTGSVKHGPAVSGLIRKWKTPTLTVSAAECSQYGLKLTYASDYTASGNLINVVSVLDGATELIANYALTNQDYQGELLLPWGYLSGIPSENDTLDITMQLIEPNGIVSVTSTASLTVTYDSEEGFSFNPAYTVTNRMTIEASITAYDSVELYMQRTDLSGNNVWQAVEEIASDDASNRLFEIIPAFGSSPTVMWVITHTTGGTTRWGYRKVTLNSSFNLSTKYYVWNWIDDEKVPHAYIMKYRANAIVQPGDSSTLPANKFVTTGRDYPIYRYSKSIDRSLDIEGAILNDESDAYSTRADAETLLVADHTYYRQPNGKWYQTALKSVSFTRERVFDTIQISQEAESR